MKFHYSIFIAIAVLLLMPTLSYGNTDSDNSMQQARADSTMSESSQPLNEIRFGNWTKEDWGDNEYIRCVRKTFNDYLSGKIKREDFDEYKNILSGKFLINNSTPYIRGGLYIEFVFVDNPQKLFATVIYSKVDRNTKRVSDYQMQELVLMDSDLPFSKDDIHQFLEDCPDAKLF